MEVLDTTSQPSFLLKHYGNTPVTYDASTFVERNRDELSADIIRVFGRQSCNFGFAAYLFSADISQLTEFENRPISAKQTPLRHRIVPGCGADMLSTGHSLETFSQDFAQQIDHFLKSIGSSRVRFIHCAKPNKDFEYRKFDSDYVLQQITRLDILPTAQLLSAGLPYCVSYEEFNNRYRFLAHRYNQETDIDAKPSEEAKVILDCYLKAVDDSNMPYTSNQWVAGNKHIFLSQGAHDQLETLRRSSNFVNSAPSVSNWLKRSCNGTIDLSPTHRQKPFIENWRLNGLDLNPRPTSQFQDQSPPSLPPLRNYSVHGDKKVHFPQRRVMTESYKDENSGVDLRSGDIVTVIGNSNQSKHLLLNVGQGKTCSIPSTHTKLTVR